MPPRAAANLRRQVPPTGDTGDWPLDDARVAVFRETMDLRKKVNGAAQLYRALFLVTAIFGGVVLLLAGLAALGAFAGARPRGGGGGPGAAAAGVGVAGVFVVGFCLLYFFAWRGTHRSQRWAPLTMFVLWLLNMAFVLFAVVMAAASGSGTPDDLTGSIVGGLLGMILPAVFAVVSWRAFAAIPRYLAQPAWCQELIAASKL
jgi:hypothetical protein